MMLVFLFGQLTWCKPVMLVVFMFRPAHQVQAGNVGGVLVQHMVLRVACMNTTRVSYPDCNCNCNCSGLHMYPDRLAVCFGWQSVSVVSCCLFWLSV